FPRAALHSFPTRRSSDLCAAVAAVRSTASAVSARYGVHVRHSGCLAHWCRPLLLDPSRSAPPLPYLPPPPHHACEQRFLGQYGEVRPPEDRTHLPIRPRNLKH